MSADNQYVLNWNNYSLHLKKAFTSLLKANESVDVTLTCEGKKISAHKMLLSAGSTFFHDLFRDNPCEHTIVILSDVKFQDLECLLTFMYTGEVSVPTENFDSFLKTAELLHVSGLPGNRRRPMNAENKHGSEAHDEAELSQHTRSLLKRHAQTDNSNTSEEKPRKRLQLEVDPTTTTEIKQEQVEVLKTEPEEVPLDDNFNTSEENPSKRLKLEMDPTAVTEIKQEHVEILKTKPEELPLDDALRIDTDAKPQASTPFSLLSERQKAKHRWLYQDFIAWRIQNKFRGVNEKILLEYFNKLGTTCKRTKLRHMHSMLKLTLNEFEHVDITRFPLLLKYNKERQNTRTLESKHVKDFLLGAPDYQYLHAKIVLVLAVAGKCSCVELCNLKLQGVEDEGSFLSITLPSTETIQGRKFVVTNEEFGVNVVDLFKKYMALRPNDGARPPLCKRRFLYLEVSFSKFKASGHVSLDCNLWICSSLLTIFEYLDMKNIKYINGSSYRILNIRGISCLNENIPQNFSFFKFTEDIRNETKPNQIKNETFSSGNEIEASKSNVIIITTVSFVSIVSIIVLLYWRIKLLFPQKNYNAPESTPLQTLA